jgi:hypothetical protein
VDKPIDEAWNDERQWRLEGFDFTPLQRERVVDDERLFYLLCSASFIEMLSDLYTQNLARYYAGDQEVEHWLKCQWELEEVQHGRSLRAYILHVWNDFNWDRAYSRFANEYGTYCVAANLEPTRGLEMAARCVVETGTSTLYRALLSDVSQNHREPVLMALLNHIRTDEVRHFKYFYRFFKAYQDKENNSLYAILKALSKRVMEAKGDDGYLAYQYVFQEKNPDKPFKKEIYQDFVKTLKNWARLYYPYQMAVEMLMTPLPMSPKIKRAICPPLIRLAKIGGF